MRDVTDTDIRREQARETDGRFGTQHHSAPEMTLGVAMPRLREVTATLELTRRGVRSGLLRRRRDITDQVEVTTAFMSVPREHAIPGDRGERIIYGQAHLPVMWGDEPLIASPGTLKELVHVLGVTASTTGPTRAHAAEQLRAHVRTRARDIVLIGNEVWSRASMADGLSS